MRIREAKEEEERLKREEEERLQRVADGTDETDDRTVHFLLNRSNFLAAYRSELERLLLNNTNIIGQSKTDSDMVIYSYDVVHFFIQKKKFAYLKLNVKNK